jgi:hypothetical protein
MDPDSGSGPRREKITLKKVNGSGFVIRTQKGKNNPQKLKKKWRNFMYLCAGFEVWRLPL